MYVYVRARGGSKGGGEGKDLSNLKYRAKSSTHREKNRFQFEFLIIETIFDKFAEK